MIKCTVLINLVGCPGQLVYTTSSTSTRRDSINTSSNKTHRQAAIATVLALSFGTLVGVAVLSVLGVSLYSGLTNTRELLIKNATVEMATVKRSLTNLFDPMENRARDVANLIYQGEINPDDETSIDKGLLLSLSGARHIIGIGFLYPDLTVKMAERASNRVVKTEYTDSPVTAALAKEMKVNPVGSWGPLTYVPNVGEAVLNFRQPITKDGVFVGVVLIAVPVSEVSAIIQNNGLAKDEARFILYGKNHLLTQQGFRVDSSKLTYKGITPKLSDISDPILSTIWTARRIPFRLYQGGANFQGHYTEVDGNRYQFIYSELNGYTDKPLIIGYRLPYEDAGKQVIRLALAGLVGVIILIISIGIALVIGRKISRPIKALAIASQKISSLDFDKVDTLPPSRLKELNEASEAYNTMLRGLSWFENYVPKSLVRKLMSSGDPHSETRDVTVMFTDIVGFTPQAENMSSEAVAQMLNHHFELVTSCIEAEGGTVDKFIGDAVMAFWGAPELQEDHTARACRAAIAIRKAIIADNTLRTEKGLTPIKMRIGIHTGQLVVGNIGSSGRLNYTVVGDTVNVAQRIEQLGKELAPRFDDDILILVSADVRTEAHLTLTFEDAGLYSVKGRDGKLEIFHLT